MEDLLHERGIDVSHETVRFWWNRFGPMFAVEIRRKRIDRMRTDSNWRRHVDEVFVKINGEPRYHWRAFDHEGELLEAVVAKRRDKRAVLKVFRKLIKRYWRSNEITTDRLQSYRAALRTLGAEGKQAKDRWTNNRIYNSHHPSRRRERAMVRFRRMRSLQTFAAIHSSVHNHFNLDRHLKRRLDFKLYRAAALEGWRRLGAA